MSRIIIKGLPKGLKEERLRSLFKEKGTVTDCSLKYTRDGVFRKFAFIGFSSEEEASASVKHFDRSFIDTSRITVEIAKDFGDDSKPRAWSKYSRDSSAYQKMIEKLEKKQEKKVKAEEEKKSSKKKTNKVDELLGELKDDVRFQEFVEAHKNKTTKATWSNDTGVTAEDVTAATSSSKETVVYDDTDDDDEAEDPDDVVEEENDAEEAADKVATKPGISDLDYLKSKMTKNSGNLLESSDSDSAEDDSSTSESESERTKKKKSPKKKASKSDVKENVDSSSESGSEEEGSSSEEETEEAKGDDSQVETKDVSDAPVRHVIKMKGLPTNVRDNQIKEFFSPLAIVRIKIPKNPKGNITSSVATVEFSSEKDTDQSMRKNKNFIGPKRIFLYKVKKELLEVRKEKPRVWEEKKEVKNDEEEETIAESGRLYIRNLSYLCKEDDLEAHFGKYGPLSEVHLPIDSITRKVKGFAFITYMIPEHAVKAFTELDGTAFQGRMLHILPGKAKKEDSLEITDDMSFKKKREMKQKQQANSSHNWNSLFLGTSAVADVMAEKYGATKSQILDADSRQSLGVRMALGETQLVAETKQFLLDNGVCLDAFGQAASARSKTVILVKNLPAGTSADDLRQIFSRHGILGRLVLPPSGVTAIVEFLEPTEARSAFRSLAYTKFQHLPLYLEWAPVDALKGSDKTVKPSTSETGEKSQGAAEEEPMDVEEKKKEESESSSESEDEPEPESTIYVKNLNFDTTEEALKEHFSSIGEIRNITIAKKKDMKNPGNMLSMGFGFVEYKTRASAQKSMKTLQHSMLDDHQLELKASNKQLGNPTATKKKQDTKKKQTSTKILVRNIPFEAKVHEIKQLFSTFGELKTVRLPKKLGGTGNHRGFCFVDFLTKQDAKRAFKALCVSTRLYGRRLVLEWADSDDTVEQLRKKTADHFHDEAPTKRLKKSALMEELKLAAD